MIPQGWTLLLYQEPIHFHLIYIQQRKNIFTRKTFSFIQMCLHLGSFELVEFSSQVLNLFLYTARTICWDFRAEHTVYCSVVAHWTFFIIKHWTVLFSTLLISRRGMATIIVQSLNHLECWRKCNFLGEGSWWQVPWPSDSTPAS